MRARLIASAAVLAVVLAIVILREPGPGASARPPEQIVQRRPPSPSPAAAESERRWPARDPFRYAEERREPVASIVSRPPSPPAPSAPPATPNPLRLVGLVRRAGVLKAAVSMWGETIVLGPGEESRGYKVLSIDDEGGVRLQGPDGVELTLLPSAF